MAEPTPQKRVLPARERADSTAKRQAASPATPASEPRVKRKYTRRAGIVKAPTPTTETPNSSTPVHDVLPSKIHAAGPMPTSSQKQPEKLSNKEYQTIAESAVLAASLHRSRMQWLCEGIFKRYWTKPVKRKGVIEQPPGNPDVKSMSKLGNATMTIEPHVFDVTFYTVKDLSSIPPPAQRHPNQHTVNKPNTAPSTLPAVQRSPIPPASPTPLTAAHPTKSNADAPSTVASVSPATIHAPTSAPAPVLKHESTGTPATPIPSVSRGSISTATPPVAHLPTQSVAPAPPQRTANDPVIQMLAARAATDNRLKELMKVVAMSKANKEQLDEFQKHIDEFNRIVKEQDAKKTKSEAVQRPVVPAAAHPATYTAPPRPYPGPPTSIGGPLHMAPPAYMPYPQQRPEPYIKHIIVEFHSAASATQNASTDRWMFPERAILDIKSGGMEMIASFFVVCKGEDILKRGAANDGGDNSLRQQFKANVEYYQPVSVIIKATQHKTIETIARAAKSLPECQSYMKEVMEKSTRAPQEYLVYRLPRERALHDAPGIECVDSAVEISDNEDDELKDFYGM